MTYRLQNYRTDHGTKTVLVGPKGRKLLPILLMESSGLTVVKAPLSDERFLSDVIQSGKSKSMKSRVKQFRAFGKRTGMTKAAKAFLTKATKAV